MHWFSNMYMYKKILKYSCTRNMYHLSHSRTEHKKHVSPLTFTHRTQETCITSHIHSQWMWEVIHVWLGFFLWGLCVCACLYLYFHWRSNYLQKGRSFGSLNQFNPATFFVPVPNRELVLHRHMWWYFVCSMICLRFVLFILMELWLFFINICNDVRVIVTTNS
jgi:ABC-type multidrug transport system permease subunit